MCYHVNVCMWKSREHISSWKIQMKKRFLSHTVRAWWWVQESVLDGDPWKGEMREAFLRQGWGCHWHGGGVVHERAKWKRVHHVNSECLLKSKMERNWNLKWTHQELLFFTCCNGKHFPLHNVPRTQHSGDAKKMDDDELSLMDLQQSHSQPFEQVSTTSDAYLLKPHQPIHHPHQKEPKLVHHASKHTDHNSNGRSCSTGTPMLDPHCKGCNAEPLEEGCGTGVAATEWDRPSPKCCLSPLVASPIITAPKNMSLIYNTVGEPHMAAAMDDWEILSLPV